MKRRSFLLNTSAASLSIAAAATLPACETAGNDKQLKTLKLKYKSFSPEQIEGINDDNSDTIVDLLKSFLLKQYLTTAPENE